MIAPRRQPKHESQRAGLLRDERGVTAVIVAIALPLLFGFGMLAINTGVSYTIKRQNQSAADAAAISAAYEIIAGNTNVANKLEPAATQAATQNGWVNTGIAPAVTYPYSDTYVTSGVEVALHQDQSSLFPYSPLASMTIATRAVALVNELGPSCLTALSPTGIGPTGIDVDVQGSSIINMPNCIVAANSNGSSAVHVQGGANSNLTAGSIVTRGNITTTGSPTLSLQWPAQVGAPSVTDPYAAGTCTTLCISHNFLINGPPAMPTSPTCGAPASSIIGGVTWWTYPGNCVVAQSGSTLNQSNIILQGTTQISGGIQIKNQTVRLSPGTYWINNGDLQLGPGGGTSRLECTGCNGTNLGVTIIFTTTGAPNKIGTVTMQSTSAQIGNLNAPNTGHFAGLLFAQDTVAGANYTTSGTLEGGPSLAFAGTGLIYIPHSNMTFQGNPTGGTSGCLLLVANTVTVAGNSTLSATGCTGAGLGTTPTVSKVVLAE